MNSFQTAISDRFFVAGGTLPRDVRSYVERRADHDLYESLLQGTYCYVLTSRQMGKSSLMNRTAARLREAGVSVAIVDLSAIGHNVTVEQWYVSMLDWIGEWIGFAGDEVKEFWKAEPLLSPLRKWMRVVRELLLARCPGGLVIFVDEVDYVRNLPFRTDEFFAGIRELYNLRAGDDRLDRLTVCLLGVAKPSDLISDRRITPFNIGHRIELHDFTTAEAAPLARGLGCDRERNASLLRRVLYWTGGHPYLTQKLCQSVVDDGRVADDGGVDRACERLFLSRRAREEEDNLQFVGGAMLAGEMDRAELLDLYAKVLGAAAVPDDAANPLIGTLRLSGIVRADGDRLKPRNRIYERVFDRRWIASKMPDVELWERRRAYRRGVLRTLFASGLLLILVGGLALIALEQRNLFQRQADANRRLLYNSRLKIAQQEWDNGNADRVEEILLEVKPRPGEEDLRGIEWDCLWQLSHAEVRSLKQERQVVAAAFSPDGGRLATAELVRGGGREGGREYRLKVHQWRENQVLSQFSVPSGSMFRRVVFAADLQKALVESEHNSARLVSLNTGHPLASFEGHKKNLSAIALSPDGSRILTAASDGEVRFWDAAAPHHPLAIRHQEQWVRWASFSPDGRRVVTASETQGLKVWDAATGRELSAGTIEEETITAAVFFPDGEKLLAAARDGSLHVWDLRRRKVIFVLAAHSAEANAMVFSPDGEKAATGGADRTVRIWDLKSRKLLATIKGHGSSVTSLAWSRNGDYLVSAGADANVKIWDVNALPGRSAAVENADVESYLATAFSDRGEFLAFGATAGGKAKIVAPATGKELLTLNEPGKAILFAVFSPGAKLLATAGRGNAVKLWDVKTGALISSPQGMDGTAYIYAAAFSPDGTRLAFKYDHENLKISDIRTGDELFPPAGKAVLAYSVAFSPAGDRVAAALGDHGVRLWFLGRSGFLDLRGHTEVVRAIAFSNDGGMLATGGLDHSVRLWDSHTGRQLKNLGRADVVTRAAFSPDGKRLVTGSQDGAVKIWDVTTGQELIVLHKHAGEVTSIIFSPDGKRLATSGTDGVVLLWRAAEIPG